MTIGDLTSLANVKAWLSPPLASTADDVLLTRLITAASRFLLGYLDRPSLLSQSYSELRDGTGRRRMMLRQWPATAVTSLTIDGEVIPVAASGPLPAAGYVLDPWNGWSAGQPQQVSLMGYAFRRGALNVAITYTAGYAVSGELANVPAGTPYTLTTQRSWAGDIGVAYASGGLLTAVASNPAPGQYSVANGIYSFNAGDAGAVVLLSYSYLPAEIEQACIELVALRYQERQRVGQVSKSLAGEVVSFAQKDMPADVTTALQPYRRVFMP